MDAQNISSSTEIDADPLLLAWRSCDPPCELNNYPPAEVALAEQLVKSAPSTPIWAERLHISGSGSVYVVLHDLLQARALKRVEAAKTALATMVRVMDASSSNTIRDVEALKNVAKTAIAQLDPTVQAFLVDIVEITVQTAALQSASQTATASNPFSQAATTASGALHHFALQPLVAASKAIQVVVMRFASGGRLLHIPCT